MASDPLFVEQICQLAQPLGVVRSRKMFGDWLVYIDEKPAILVCDNIAYIKMLPKIVPLMADAEIGCPYEGAKQHYILDVEHRSDALAILRTLLPLLPLPKDKKPKNTK